METISLAKGTYERTSSDNYDDFLKALGVNYILRKAASSYEKLASTLHMEVIGEDNTWSIKTYTILNSIEFNFKVGETFEETTLDGRVVDSTVTIDGNKFICVQIAKKNGQISTKSIREFTDRGCTHTLEITGTEIANVQQFKRI